MLSFIHKIFKTKEGKTIASNLGYLTLMQVANYVFPFITLPYLARVLGVDKFGVLAIGAAVVSYFQSITDYGFNYTAVKKIARCKDDVEKTSQIVSSTICAKILLMCLCALILALCITFVPYFQQYKAVIVATFLLIPGNILFADWFFQAVEDMKYITLLSVISKFVFTVLVFVIVKKPQDYLYQPLLIAAGYMVSAIVGTCIMTTKFKVRLYVPSILEIMQEVKEGFNMFVALFLPTIYTNLNVLILGGYNGDKATGIYSGATKFTSLAYNLFMLVSRAVYPYFARQLDKHTIYARMSFVFSVLLSGAFVILAKPLVLLLLGPEFEETIVVLRIVALTPIAMSITNSYGVNYLVLKGKEVYMRNIVVVITLVGVILGVYGAIRYSYIGVAVASLVTQSIRAFMIYISAKRVMKETLV